MVEDDTGRDLPKAARGGGGERLELNLGRRCNQRCVFCMESAGELNQNGHLPIEEAEAELRRFAAAHPGPKALGFLGGEPTLYRSLFDLLDLARSLGYTDITINSNGFGMANEAFARRAVEAGIRRFCLSIHSEIPQIEDELSGQSGAYMRKLRALRNLLFLRHRDYPALALSINAVLTARNLPTMDRFLQFYGRLGIRDIRLNSIRPEGRALKRPELVPRLSDVIPKLMELVELNERELHLHLTFGEIPYCMYPSSFFADRTLRHRYIGEYIDERTQVTTRAEAIDTDHFVWQDRKNQALKSHAPACLHCVWMDVCGGVWSHYLNIHGAGEFHALKD